jgi:hypothetical protein
MKSGNKTQLSRTELPIDGRRYDVGVMRKTAAAQDAPRLVVVSRQQSDLATDVVRVCIQAVQHFTREPHELWVVDNNSPRDRLDWLLEWPDLNVALNFTDPRPGETESGSDEPGRNDQLTWASYANAIGLEIAVRLIDPRSKYLMSMHMDTMPCHPQWLSFLKSKITERVRAAGVRIDTTRTQEGVLHVLGYMVDFQLFRELGLDYFPALPDLDVGDRITLKLRESGYEVFACPNTLWQPELATRIPASSPLRELQVDRSFDDDGQVIFLHLGRGVTKSIGVHQRGTPVDEWVRFADERLFV